MNRDTKTPALPGAPPRAAFDGVAAPTSAPARRAAGTLQFRVLAPFTIAMLALAALTIAGFEVLSAVRAFVGGESLWSKSRAEAVQALTDYSARRRPEDRERFERSLVIPAGDHEARIELNKPEPDFARARDGFIRGGNHIDDVDGMMRLYRRFHDTGLMRRAVVAWIEGDRGIDELRRIAATLEADGPAGGAAEAADPALRARIDRISADLATVEKEFSASLGEASLKVESLLTGAVVSTTALLLVAGLLLGRRTLALQEVTERELAEANWRWEMAAHSAGIGVFELDARSDEVRLDARARAHYGLDASGDRPVRRADIAARVHADDWGLVALRADPAASRIGELHKGRYRIVHADGVVRHVEAVGSFHEAAHAGDSPRFIGIVRDVTDELDKVRLQVERDAAERVAKSRVEFLSRLSHEIRTPLNAILGFSQLLAMDRVDRPTPLQAKRLELIAQGGNHLLRLVEDVLDLSSVDSGAVEVHIEPTGLQALLETALVFVEPERERMAVRIDNRVPGTPLTVLADPRRLLQVFSNLLTNGCKYNVRGGKLTIECTIAGDEVVIGFRDQGAGMTPEQVKLLFQPFKRLPGHAAIAGTGMGLVIVRLLLHHMDGSVEVDSRPGAGSCFSVRLRRAI